jgi:hypothetical protein
MFVLQAKNQLDKDIENEIRTKKKPIGLHATGITLDVRGKVKDLPKPERRAE